MAPWCIHISCLERVARSGSGRDSVRSLVGAMDAELSRPDWLATVQSGRKQVQSRVCTPSLIRHTQVCPRNKLRQTMDCPHCRHPCHRPKEQHTVPVPDLGLGTQGTCPGASTQKGPPQKQTFVFKYLVCRFMSYLSNVASYIIAYM